MEIFKLFESTISNIQPGHPHTKDLRRDQLLDNYDEATKTLEALIKAKENEIAYRRDLISMLDKSKQIYDNKLIEANQAYQTAKKHAPSDLDLKITTRKPENSSATPPLSSSSTPTPISTNPPPAPNLLAAAPNSNSGSQTSSSLRSSDLDIPLPSDHIDGRSSLDRRLSEFLKTFPNLTQAGLALAANNNNINKPMPGYYTQQAPPLPPPVSAEAPPLMAMMRFPPPPLMPPHHGMNPASQENHDTADMDLSDYEESSNSGPPAGGLIPMVASAMQQGAGGKQHLSGAEPQQSFVAGQQFNNPIQYAPRLSSLPYDPSIMEPRLRDSSSSSGGRSSERSHRHSGGVKHGSDKKYSSSSSSHSSSRSKRR